jgi:[ribosomal protein S5]-alanine N-acetyltransferase
MLFETERLYVDTWKLGDLKQLYELFNDEGIKAFVTPELTIEETVHIFEKQIDDYAAHFPFGRYFIQEKSSESKIGILLFKKYTNKHTVEIGYSLKKEHWKKGLATEVVNASVKWLLEDGRFSDIYAVTEPDNIKSQRVLFKCGFDHHSHFLENNTEMDLFYYRNNE